MPNNVNPFTPGSGLDPPYLAGRDGVLKEFFRMLQRVKAGKVENVLVYGIMGVGKTVLLNKFAQICSDEHVLPMLRLQYNAKYSNPQTFLDTLRHDLEYTIDEFSKLKRTKRKIRSAAKYLKPKSVEISGVLSYQPSYNGRSNSPLEDQIAECLVDAWTAIKKFKLEGVVFLLDEFHTVKNLQEKNWYTLTDFLGAINTVQIQGYKYSFVLCGLPPMTTNIKIARSYSERMFRSEYITNLEEPAARKAITEPLKKTKWHFSNELVSAVVRETDSYPYFIQFFANEIIERTGKKRIGIGDYKKIRDEILDKLGRDFFDKRMESLSNGQQNVLCLMAEIKENAMSFSSICNSLGMGKGPISNYLKRLEEKGLIYRLRRGDYQFSIPLLRTYLLEKNKKKS